MSKFYKNHSFFSDVYKHKNLPILSTYEFDFWRCIEFKNNFYNKTVSELFQGNLRKSLSKNRYSDIFYGQKLSYWSDSSKTARREIKKHGASNNILTFWAYDDASSTFPTLGKANELKIIDGREIGFKEILEKCDNNKPLSHEDNELIKILLAQDPDCVAYKSFVDKSSMNFIFFEKGFCKLALREVNLRLGDLHGKNTQKVVCACTSDYSPLIESYGQKFLPIAKISMDPEYKNSYEFKNRKRYLKASEDPMLYFTK